MQLIERIFYPKQKPGLGRVFVWAGDMSLNLRLLWC